VIAPSCTPSESLCAARRSGSWARQGRLREFDFVTGCGSSTRADTAGPTLLDVDRNTTPQASSTWPLPPWGCRFPIGYTGRIGRSSCSAQSDDHSVDEEEGCWRSIGCISCEQTACIALLQHSIGTTEFHRTKAVKARALVG
jgi:hypothetical protein